MTDIEKIQLQRWWIEQLRKITRKVMAEEEKRQAKEKKKADKTFNDLGIVKRSDIDELYGIGVITSKQRDKMIDAFEKSQVPDVMYQAKIDLLQEFYGEAQTVMRDLGQEV